MAICSVAGIPGQTRIFCCGKLILKVGEKAMIRNRYNRIPHPTPDTSRDRYKKDEQYQLELPTIETLPWNDQYKINGGGGVCVCVGGGVLNPCTQPFH